MTCNQKFNKVHRQTVINQEKHMKSEEKGIILH